MMNGVLSCQTYSSVIQWNVRILPAWHQAVEIKCVVLIQLTSSKLASNENSDCRLICTVCEKNLMKSLNL